MAISLPGHKQREKKNNDPINNQVPCLDRSNDPDRSGDRLWILFDTGLHAIRERSRVGGSRSGSLPLLVLLEAVRDSRMTFEFTVTGNPIVKKNTQRAVFRRGYPIIVYSPQYREWAHRAMDELMVQKKPQEPIDYPVLLVCKFFMQTKRVVDLSALYEGIQDVLVQMHVLKDDNFNYVAGHDGSRVLIDRKNPRTEVTIVPLQG